MVFIKQQYRKIQIMLKNRAHNIRSKLLPESKCLLNFPEKNVLLNKTPGNKNTIIYIMVLNAIFTII
ncbi:hypothetical protein ATB96_17875 [Elizabethkingia ursingii]|nr:hypothetical protein ATB96_17875 [Elizabethkingia ursingii]